MMSGLDIAAIILAGGMVAGGAVDRFKRLAQDRREERQRKINGPEPVCGCGHHLAYHDLRDLRCYAEVKRPKAELAADGTRIDTWQQCECRRYAGPEPLATLYAPQIARAGVESVELDALDASNSASPTDSAT